MIDSALESQIMLEIFENVVLLLTNYYYYFNFLFYKVWCINLIVNWIKSEGQNNIPNLTLHENLNSKTQNESKHECLQIRVIGLIIWQDDIFMDRFFRNK